MRSSDAALSSPAPLVGVIVGLERDITDADDAFLAIVGFTREDFEAGAMSWRKMTPPELHHLDEAALGQALESGGFSVPYRKELFRKDGSRVPVLFVCAALPETRGKWMGYVVDLSTPVALPAAPEDARARLGPPLPEDFYSRLVSELVRERTQMVALMDNTDALIWAVDSSFRLLSANHAFQVTQRRESGRNMQIGEWLLGPEYPEEVRAPWYEWYGRALRGECLTGRATVHHPDGVRHYENVLSPIRDPRRGIIGVNVISQDVTARIVAEEALRSSEARFRTLTAGSPLGIFLSDTSGNCVYANPRLAAIWELPAHEMLGQGYASRVHPDDVGWVVEGWLAAVGAGEELTTEYRLAFPDGRERHVRVWVAPVREGGKVTGYVGSVVDDTEQRALASRLRQSEKMESLGTLAGGIAHDFNNMLGVVLACTELAMLDAQDRPELEENLVAIRTASLRARDLVRQILAFSRRSERELAPIDLRAVTAESLRMMRATLPATVALDARLPDGSITVLGDATALQQVIVNLCTNAEHAMRGSGGGRLSVQLAAEGDAQHGRAVLTVRDTGHGMNAELRDRIFEPFFTTKPVGEGTGMGLAVVHGILASYGGTISVESAPGAGATFRVTLPLAAAVVAKPSRPSPEVRGSGRVLLADDEPALSRIAERALSRAGYAVVCCRDGAEALRRFREAPNAIDIVVSDVSMPGLTGDRLAREIHLLRPGLPFILMTGFSHTVAPESAYAGGIAAVLQKPFTTRDLVLAVRDALESAKVGT
jgi:two-component system cell cycle sensor histidine kinase/response regulator CckA